MLAPLWPPCTPLEPEVAVCGPHLRADLGKGGRSTQRLHLQRLEP